MLIVDQRAIQSEQRRVIAFFNDVNIRFLDQSEIEVYDPDGQSFININTPADLQRARSMLDPK